MRDLRTIGNKIVQVLHPTSGNAVLQDWDLWGPLIVRPLSPSLSHVDEHALTQHFSLQFCLTLAILLSTNGAWRDSPARELGQRD